VRRNVDNAGEAEIQWATIRADSSSVVAMDHMGF
jgi:hypothetical protein